MSKEGWERNYEVTFFSVLNNNGVLLTLENGCDVKVSHRPNVSESPGLSCRWDLGHHGEGHTSWWGQGTDEWIPVHEEDCNLHTVKEMDAINHYDIVTN